MPLTRYRELTPLSAYEVPQEPEEQVEHVTPDKAALEAAVYGNASDNVSSRDNVRGISDIYTNVKKHGFDPFVEKVKQLLNTQQIGRAHV